MDNVEMLQLAGEFAALGAELHGEDDNRAALQRMVDLAVKYVPGCSWASVTVIERGKASTIAASDEVARTADQLQYATGEGPCLSSATHNTSCALPDVQAESRWPRFCAAVAHQTPVQSVLSFHLPAKESAALNLFGEVAGAFGDESLVTGSIFAAHASSTVALYEAEFDAENLKVALEGSRQIGTALGILMAHHKVTQDAAFVLLTRASQRLNRKLREIAGDVVDTGELPTR